MEEVFISFIRSQRHFLIPIQYVEKILGIQEVRKDKELLEQLPIIDFRNDEKRNNDMMILICQNDKRAGVLIDQVEGVRETADGIWCDLPMRLVSEETKYIEKLIVFQQERRIDVLLNMELLYQYARIGSLKDDI